MFQGIKRIWRGELQSRSELRWIIGVLLATAGTSFALCWAYYPTPESFSMTKDTISNFGKIEKYHDPLGHSFFQIGFASLCLLFAICTAYRQQQMHIAPREEVARTTQLYLGGILCLMLTLFVPDSSKLYIFGIKSRLFHGAIVIIGIGLFVSAILRDALMVYNLHLLRRIKHPHARRAIPLSLWPFLLFVGLFSIGLTLIAIWEVRCLFNDQLKHWPGDGIFSMPMWEWILFSYLLIFMCWFPQLAKQSKGPRGGISQIHAWSRH